MRVIASWSLRARARWRQFFAALTAMLYLCLEYPATADTKTTSKNVISYISNKPQYGTNNVSNRISTPINLHELIWEPRFIGAILCQRRGLYFFKNGTIIGYLSHRPVFQVDYGNMWTSNKYYTCRQWRHWDGQKAQCMHHGNAPKHLFSDMRLYKGQNCWRVSANPPITLNDQTISNMASPTMHWMFESVSLQKSAKTTNTVFRDQPDLVRYAGQGDQILKRTGLDKTPYEMSVTGKQLTGYIASLLVLLTFCMREMVWLRAVALSSNIAFMTYGYVATLPPVFLLHIILFPINFARLMQLIGTTSQR